MIEIEKILSIITEREFKESALKLFRIQAERCPPYREYLSLLGVDSSQIESIEKIPFLPIEFFKSHKIYYGVGEPEKVFTSSSTSGQEPSKHYMASLSNYEATFQHAFKLFYGLSSSNIAIYALLPNYLERDGSSLIYMVDNLINSGGGGFYLYDYEKLLLDLSNNNSQKILLGVSYALLDLAEKHTAKLQNTIVMETGGMKGRGVELPKKQLHELLCHAFGVEKIHSEYGMAELTSQAYSYGEGVFMTPPWMRILTRDLNDPFEIFPVGKSGGINIIDLANINSCAFIQTQDLGIVSKVGVMEAKENQFISTIFSTSGRIDRSEIRGCNLLI